jgi:DnaD/phage-associated family protein
MITVKQFQGFSNQKTHLVPIPEPFFHDLLPLIDHVAEFKVTLYAFWFLDQQEGSLRFIRYQDFLDDKTFLTGLGTSYEMMVKNLSEGLNRAVKRGTFLTVHQDSQTLTEAVYFLNTPQGRAAYTGFQEGAWSPQERIQSIRRPEPERPNIFQLYETNIGPLTPMMADILQEAEEMYSPIWVEDAIRIAVENNVRRWRYIEAILKSWEERGRDEKDRRNAQEDPKKYIDGEFGQYVKF